MGCGGSKKKKSRTKTKTFSSENLEGNSKILPLPTASTLQHIFPQIPESKLAPMFKTSLYNSQFDSKYNGSSFISNYSSMNPASGVQSVLPSQIPTQYTSSFASYAGSNASTIPYSVLSAPSSSTAESTLSQYPSNFNATSSIFPSKGVISSFTSDYGSKDGSYISDLSISVSTTPIDEPKVPLQPIGGGGGGGGGGSVGGGKVSNLTPAEIYTRFIDEKTQKDYTYKNQRPKIYIVNRDSSSYINDNDGQRFIPNDGYHASPPFRKPFGKKSNRQIVIEEEKIIEKTIGDYNDNSDNDDIDDDDFNLDNFVRNNNDIRGINRRYSNNNQNRNNKQKLESNQNRNDNENEIIRTNDKQCRLRSGHQGTCRPKGQCYYFFGDLKLMEQESCRTSVGGRSVQGICCPNDMDFTPNKRENIPYRLTIPQWPKQRLRITRGQIQQAIREADVNVIRFFNMEQLFVGPMGQVQIAFTPAHFLQLMFGPADQNQQLLNLWGFRALQVTRALGERFELSSLQMRDGLSQISLYGTDYEQYCIQPPQCDNRYKYRTIDGSCNNIRNPLWGKSLTQFERLLPPEYSDGISEFRLSVNGRFLPLPRVISTKVFHTSNENNAKFSNRWNVMFMQWGQFLDHDMSLGSSTRASTGEGLLCCNRTDAQGPLFHPACRPIYLPNDDPYYSRFNRKCNNFVRNAVGPKNACNLGYREQTNVVTSFIDASMIYGNDFNRSRLVRTFRNGLLKTGEINGKEWLPYDTMNNSLACSIRQRTNRNRCVFAGDVRVNQQLGLVALQLLFLREHNRLARILKRLNPNWNDEKLYQEARRIVSAEVQHITYNEYLPEALGRNVLRRYQISLQPNGHCFGYDPSVNPSILNEFATAAYRWHTLVQKHYYMRNANGQNTRRHEMHIIFNNPTFMYGQGAFDQVIRGILAHSSERFDGAFTEDIKNLLFAQGNPRVGMDLMSINIQRGRDHGLPTYNQIRKLCGLEPIRNFRQMQTILTNRDDWQRLSQVYSHVDDIDFWVGGNLEKVLEEGFLGPTFSCIVGEQFRRLKYGDRFWYENGGMRHSFNDEQLSQLRKVTLAGIICQNSDDIGRIQPLAMLIVSEQNPELDCSLIPKMDLSAWKSNEQRSNLVDDRRRPNRQQRRKLQNNNRFDQIYYVG